MGYHSVAMGRGAEWIAKERKCGEREGKRAGGSSDEDSNFEMETRA